MTPRSESAIGRVPVGESEGPKWRRRLLAPLVSGLLGAALLIGGCPDVTRCQHNSDCPEGQLCSNEKNLQGAGVCMSSCERHIGVAACADLGLDGGKSGDGGAKTGDAGAPADAAGVGDFAVGGDR